MKREILFRGKVFGSSTWVEGYFIRDWDMCYIYWSGIKKQVYPETVGQFTGLTDKNGVKIFEGDICTHRFKRPWSTEMHKSEVVWNQAYCCYYLNDGVSNHRMHDDMEYEVIGNIHANPELLK